MEHVMGMKVVEWFALAEVLPELIRQDKLGRIHGQLLVGDRTVKDADFKRAMKELNRTRNRVEVKLRPEDFQEFSGAVDRLNMLWREVANEG